MTRRREARGTSDRRQRHFHLPRLASRRSRLLSAAFVALVALLVGRYPGVLKPTRELLTRGTVEVPDLRVQDLPAVDAVLMRQRQGLRRLLLEAQQQRLVPPEATAVALVDQDLVRALLAPHFPRSYDIEDAYRVTITGAHVTFDDGLALVRLDGRATLLADERVFADVSVFGDLEVLREQPDAAVLRTRINVLALEARRVAVVVDARAAERLVERVGQTRLSALAAVTTGLEIPVRHQHAVELPAVTEGPVRLQPAELPVQLAVLDVKALSGKLWISMAATFEGAAEVPSFPLVGLPAPEVPPGEPSPARTTALRTEVDILRSRFDHLAADDPRVAAAASVEADVSLTVQPALFEAGVQRLAELYFDRVEIVLEDVRVRKTGERRRKLLFKEITAGAWHLDVAFTSIRGILRSGRPTVTLPGGSRVDLSFPVHIERGGGRARITFGWDSAGVVGLVCRDFELTDTVAGRVLPRAYPVTATFTVTAGEDRLVATPRFSDRFRIHPQPDLSSWNKLALALEEQDRFGRCGIGLDPEAEMKSVRALVERGFVVRLPRKLFRPVTLPTRLTPVVQVQGRPVQLTLRQSDLALEPGGVRYDIHLAADRARP